VETQVTIVVEMVEQEHQTILQEQQRLTLAVVVEVLLVLQVDLAELVVVELVEMIPHLQDQLEVQLQEKMQLQTLVVVEVEQEQTLILLFQVTAVQVS